MDKRYCFYLGFPKTATTFLQLCLCEHPDIDYLQKSRFFVGEDFDKGFEWYESIFSNDTAVRVEGDEMLISDEFLPFEQTIERIKGCVPDAKIIITTRNKRDLFKSYYLHSIRERYHSSVKDFLGSRDGQLMLSMLDMETRIEKCRDLFKPENVLVMDLDEIKVNPVQVVKRMYTFLGVDENFVPETLEGKANVSPSELALWFIKYFHLIMTPYDWLKRKLMPLYRSIQPKKIKQVNSAEDVRRLRLNNASCIRRIEFVNTGFRANVFLYRPVLSRFEPTLTKLVKKWDFSLLDKEDLLEIDRQVNTVELTSKKRDEKELMEHVSGNNGLK